MNEYQVTDECNPGGGTDCPCSLNDAGIEYFNDHINVTSNVNQKPLWINSISYHKFIDSLPGNIPLVLNRYKYIYQTRMVELPRPDTSQISNPQAVHLMIQLYNGGGSIWSGAKEAREGAIYWELNPWNNDYGKIKVYSTNFQLIETGIILNPDTNWHLFGLEMDFTALKYQKIYIDTLQKDISDIPILVKSYPDWGNENALSLTAESMATWPGNTCKFVFQWTQQFRNAQLFVDSLTTDIQDNYYRKTEPPIQFIQHENYLTLFSSKDFLPITIKLTDITGRLILQKEIINQEEKLVLTHINRGLFIIEIRKRNRIWMRKIII